MSTPGAAGPPPDPIDLTPTDLGPLGVAFARGGEAVLHGLPGLSLAGTTGPLVYKRYLVPQGARRGLTALVRARQQLDEVRRRRLDTVAAWPVRRVVEAGTVRGVVMPLVAERFHIDLTLPQSGRTERRVHDLQTLLLPTEKALRAGRPEAGLALRMRVARDAAAAMAFLHDEMDVVLGDVSPRNTVIDLHGTERVQFIDCDSMRIRSAPLDHRQLHTPDWNPPNQETASRATDLYKLGLLILRTLVPRPMASTDRDPDSIAGVLDAEGSSLLRRALDPLGDPGHRPRAHDWFVHLSHALGEPVRPPALSSVVVEPTLLVPGTPTTVRWALDTPARIEVRSAGTVLAAIDAGTGTGRLDALPPRSGALSVLATNAFGSDSVITPAVIVLRPPSFDDLPVPVPRFETPDSAGLPVPAPSPPAVPLRLIDAMALAPLPPPWLPVAGAPTAPGPWTALPPVPLPDPVDAPFDLLDAVTARPDLPRATDTRGRARR